jgi:hypothetical protein
MADLTKGLLNLNLSPEQAMLLDRQAREQQIQQQTQATPDVFRGMLQQAMRTADTLQNVPRALMGEAPPMGANQRMAIQQEKQLDSLRKQASEIIMSSPEIGEQRASGLLKAVQMDKTGSLSNKVIERFAIQAMDTSNPYGHLSVVGNRVFNKKTQKYISPPQDASGKPTKLEDVAETYGVSTKDLEPKEIAKLGVIASDLSSQGKKPEEIQTALNSEIVSMFDKKEEATAETKDRALRSQLNAMDSLIASAEQAGELAPESFADASVNAIAGFLGVPWTEGLALENYVKQIQANLAFDRLQQMRDSSKTGGALGQVSNIELELLKSSLTALDPKDKNFKQQLQTVIKHYKAFSASLRGRVPDGYREIDGRVFEFGSDGKWYEVLGEGNE